MPRTYYRSFIKDNAIVTAGHVLVYLKGIILMPVIVKSVGVTVYGGFALLTSLCGFVFGLSSFGVGFRAKRFMPSAKTLADRGELFYPQFYFNVLTVAILSLLFVLLKRPLDTYLFKGEVQFSTWIIPAYLLSYLLYSQASDYFRYTSRVSYMTLAVLCFPYLHIGFILFYVYISGPVSINMLMLSMALSALLISIPSFWLILREIGGAFSWDSKSNLIQDIKLGFPLALGFVVDFILAGSDRCFIASYLSVTDVGNYVPAYVLGSLTAFLPKAMATALPQLMCQAIDNGDDAEARRMLNYAVKIYLLLTIPLVFGCLALGKPILALLTNRGVAEKAFWVAPIVALGTLFYGLTILLWTVLFVRTRTYDILRMNLIAALVSVLANGVVLHFVPHLIVPALTTLASYLSAYLLCHRLVVKEWAVDFAWGSIVKSIVASMIMFGIVFCFASRCRDEGPTVVVLGLVALGGGVYTGCLLVLRAFSAKELGYVKGLILRAERA